MISFHSVSSMFGISGFLGRARTACKLFNSALMESSEKIDNDSEAVGLHSASDKARGADTSDFGFLIHSLHPVVGTADGRGSPARGEAPSRRARVKRIIRALRALDDHWLGDLIGAACLFGFLWLALMAGMVLQ